MVEVTNLEQKTGKLADALKGADIFVGVSAPNIVTPEMVASMNKDAILFAMANPVPEIMPDIAKAAGAKVVGTGRSDFPNQVNNVVAFPGIFKGALEGRATAITEDMKLATAKAIAGLVPDEELNENNILPEAFDPRVADVVSRAVKELTAHWGEKRYYSLDYYLKKTYGEKLYKISLDGGMTCPNRDGTLGTHGCIFCSRGGSGDFAASRTLSVTEQIEAGKQQSAKKYTGSSYIAYFQAYTNTYASLEYLETLYMEAITHPDIRILSIATRPDCLSEKILDLLENLNRIKPVWVELGLQTIHEESARYIRRGYELPVFENAVSELRKRGIDVIVHTILCLPNETEQDILKTIEYLNHQDIQGIKLQLLHVLKDTDLADIYLASPFYIPTPEEYYQLLGMCISHLRPDIVIHRLTGDGPKNLLIAPLWTCNKRQVLNQFQSYLKTHDIWQGKEC